MYIIKKLKPASIKIGEIILGLILISFCAYGAIQSGIKGFYTVIAMFYPLFIIYFLLLFIRTSNTGYLAFTLFFVAMSLFAWAYISNFDKTFLILLAICLIVLVIWIFFLLFTRKIKWRSREILELAANPVNETSNGFTSRPYSYGKLDYNKWELESFARFMFKNLSAIPFYEADRIAFCFDATIWHALRYKKKLFII